MIKKHILMNLTSQLPYKVRNMKNGQFSLETMIMIGMLLLIFLMVIALVTQMSSEVRDTKTKLEERAACMKMAALIEFVYSNGNNTWLNDTFDYYLNITSDGEIVVEDTPGSSIRTACSFRGKTNGIYINGNILLLNNNGTVVISSV